MENKRLEVLDGLRAIAILLVLWFHLWQLSWLAPRFDFLGYHFDLEWIPVLGFQGVDLFFFLSGFCLMIPYAQQKTARLDLKKFYFNRAIKILPSFWFSLLAICLFLSATHVLPSPFYKHFLTHFFFIQNWFSETYGSINGIFWSLAVEVQFYVLFPLICWFFLKRKILTFFIVFIFANSCRYVVGSSYFGQNAHLINQLPCVVDLFLFGMITCMISLGDQSRTLRKLTPLAATLLSVLVLSGLGFLYHSANTHRYDLNQLRSWQLSTRAFFGIGFSLFTFFSLNATLLWKKIFSNRIFIFFSAISYNLYLWHQFLAAKLMQYHIPRSQTPDPHQDSNWAWPFFLLSLTVGILFSWLLTRFLERPFLDRKRKIYSLLD